jgi:hypothetical protein
MLPLLSRALRRELQLYCKEKEVLQYMTHTAALTVSNKPKRVSFTKSHRMVLTGHQLARSSRSSFQAKNTEDVPFQQTTQSTGPQASASIGSSSSKKATLLTTTIIKSELGIGLALERNSVNEAMVQCIKEFPDGQTNPASLCDPQVLPGDVIRYVNKVQCKTFEDAVKAIRQSKGNVELVLERA